MKVFTIGFTGKSAERFFTLLETARVQTIIDTRLNNRSQLSGFTKEADLPFFLRRVANISYRYAPVLAPTAELLDSYKKGHTTWEDYERSYTALLAERHVEGQLSQKDFDQGCLLCSEHLPDRCHRRLAVEYLRDTWAGIEILHLT